MTSETWSAVDNYVNATIVRPDAALDAAIDASNAAGLPAIAVSPAHGKLLHILARSIGARRILEIGTLGGYSTIWLARALAAGGGLISLEVLDKHARVARANLERAGVADHVEIRVASALDSLTALEREHGPPFDFTFIDADKPNIPEYFQFAIRLSHPGSVIVVDNVIRNGAVIDASSTDDAVQGVRRFNDMLAREARVTATAVQTVGVKGYDGFAIAVVN